MKPAVSVIIPCYNYEEFLPEAVQSVLDQTWKYLKIIIVNDGSTDAAGTVADELAARDPRISVIHQENRGLSATRNTGLKAARGKYIQFLDADDTLHPEKLEIQVSYLEQHAKADAVWGGWTFFPEAAETIQTGPARSVQGANMLAALLKNNLMPVSAPLLRRTLTEATGTFDTTYTSYEDWQYWIRAAQRGARFDFLGIPSPCTHIRKGHSSMMKHSMRMIENGLRLRRFLHPLLSSRQRAYNAYRIGKLLLHRQMRASGLLK